MFEYLHSPDTDYKPSHALCRITVHNKNNAHDKPLSSSQKRKVKEIDHTDSNNGGKGETSLFYESVQQGGNIQNTTADHNRQILEGKLRELRKHHSCADIRKVLDQIESEKLPAASPKEHSTEAPVRNTRKRRNTMEAGGTSTQWQEQAKVEMFDSNPYREKPTNLHRDTNRNCSEFGEQSSHHGNCNEKNAEQEFEQNLQDPYNFNANLTEPTENGWYYAPTVPPITDQGTYNAIAAQEFALCNTQHGQLLDQIESEKLPAASPKEHSTDAPVSNTRKHGRCTYTNTMEAGTSTQRQEQAKVEMFESNTYREKPTNLHCDTNRNCLEKIAEQGRNTSYWKQLLSFCNTDDCFKLDDVPSFGQKLALVGSPVAMDYHNRIAPYPSTSNFATTQGRLDHQVVEPNAHFQEPKLYHNMINGNSTEPVLNNDHLLSCNQNISAPGPSTSNYATFMGGSDKQEFEQNIQDPYNFNANLTEPTENGWYLPCYYAPTVPPITDQGTYNAIEEQQFALHNTQHGQMFQPDANVQEPYNSSYNFETISTEPMEMSNDLPIYNHKIIAPGPSTSNWGTTVPGNIDYGFSFEEWELVTSEP